MGPDWELLKVDFARVGRCLAMENKHERALVYRADGAIKVFQKAYKAGTEPATMAMQDSTTLGGLDGKSLVHSLEWTDIPAKHGNSHFHYGSLRSRQPFVVERCHSSCQRNNATQEDKDKPDFLVLGDAQPEEHRDGKDKYDDVGGNGDKAEGNAARVDAVLAGRDKLGRWHLAATWHAARADNRHGRDKQRQSQGHGRVGRDPQPVGRESEEPDIQEQDRDL